MGVRDVGRHLWADRERGRPLEVGSVVEYEGRRWRVGLVNYSRARLDPLSSVVVTSPTTGRSHWSHGEPANVAPDAVLAEVDFDQLNIQEQNRLLKLAEEADAMAEVAAATPKTTAQKNKERLEQLKARKEAE